MYDTWMITRKIFAHGAVKHLLGRSCESLFTPPSPTLFLLLGGSCLGGLLTLVIVYHVWIYSHTLDHTTSSDTLVAMLVMQFFDQLEQIIIDLRLIPFSYLFLLLSINIHLSLKHGLPVWSAGTGSRTSAALRSRHGVESTLGHCGRDHGSVGGLLLDSYHDFTISLAFLIDHFRHTTMCVSLLFRGRVWRCVQFWIFILRLVLHLKLRKESLFKLGLFTGADRLPCDLLHVIELIEKVLIEIVSIEWASIPPKVHVLVGAICALMPQPRLY